MNHNNWSTDELDSVRELLALPLKMLYAGANLG